jgi:putative ABC transport system ATP-binding protein
MLKQSDIILADEPTGSLDNDNKNEVMKILKEFNEEGKTAVVVVPLEVVSSLS